MNESKRTSGPKPAASEISQGIACRHKCISVRTRAAASVLLAKGSVLGQGGASQDTQHMRNAIWRRVLSCRTELCLVVLSFSFFFFFSLDC